MTLVFHANSNAITLFVSDPYSIAWVLAYICCVFSNETSNNLTRQVCCQANMLFPVRCWTCGKVIGHLWESFSESLQKMEMKGHPIDNVE